MISIPVLLLAGSSPHSLLMAFSWMPKSFGMDGPVISASKMPAAYPRRFMVTAVTRLLPTPPLPLTTPMTFLMLLMVWGFSMKSTGF